MFLSSFSLPYSQMYIIEEGNIYHSLGMRHGEFGRDTVVRFTVVLSDAPDAVMMVHNGVLT